MDASIIPTSVRCIISRDRGCIEMYKKSHLFDQTYFALPVLNNIFNRIVSWRFYHFTYFTILEGGILRINTMTMVNTSVLLHWGNQVNHLMQK